MAGSDTEVAVIGAGAAGIAAARRLQEAGVLCLLLEARSRIGGRGWTVPDSSGSPVDLGCGWLHSADRNPWREIAEAQGYTIDRTPPPWMRPAIVKGVPLADQADLRNALQEFHRRVAALAETAPDCAAASFLEPSGRWNALLEAISTYYSGAELERVSARDLKRYEDSGVNWRVLQGYGTVIAAHGAGLPVMLDCPARRIDHSGTRLRIETDAGVITADAAIVTLPTTPLAEERLVFSPPLPDKVEAAA